LAETCAERRWLQGKPDDHIVSIQGVCGRHDTLRGVGVAGAQVTGWRYCERGACISLIIEATRKASRSKEVIRRQEERIFPSRKMCAVRIGLVGNDEIRMCVMQSVEQAKRRPPSEDKAGRRQVPGKPLYDATGSIPAAHGNQQAATQEVAGTRMT
jgi:hypothetical protein